MQSTIFEAPMFGLFSANPSKKYRKQLSKLQEQALTAQRNGDIRQYSMLSKDADDLWQKIQQMEAQQQK
ncbi:hypothetical protein HMF8227_01095 [Saliniradius amylolyticus]|uniref:Lacal_2735 family protein n=1 Tax=Saliniradius amylolyticus TaxID=2183582 RepID=A0A2S2E1Q6_9ALTE|nr:DUF6435 family protein [Saliniradius amylolyticus]AWL11581.1 hypothetical protein HMF8227_01095 [Saliniradius amylolyticus]